MVQLTTYRSATHNLFSWMPDSKIRPRKAVKLLLKRKMQSYIKDHLGSQKDHREFARPGDETSSETWRERASDTRVPVWPYGTIRFITDFFFKPCFDIFIVLGSVNQIFLVCKYTVAFNPSNILLIVLASSRFWQWTLGFLTGPLRCPCMSQSGPLMLLQDELPDHTRSYPIIPDRPRFFSLRVCPLERTSSLPLHQSRRSSYALPHFSPTRIRAYPGDILQMRFLFGSNGHAGMAGRLWLASVDTNRLGQSPRSLVVNRCYMMMPHCPGSAFLSSTDIQN